jgi:hypothetical protein
MITTIFSEMLKFSQNFWFKQNKNYERKNIYFKKNSEIFYIKHEIFQNKMIISHWNVELCMVLVIFPSRMGVGMVGAGVKGYEESSS